MAREALVATALLVREVAGAALLQDHSVAWAAAGLVDQPVQAYGDALPPDLFAAVDRDAATVAADGLGGDFKFGKRTTWWLPLRAPDGSSLAPRSAIEAAIHLLFRQDFGGESARIAGAEWWIQQQKSHDDIGYHYDKDEAYASEQMTMKFPEVSTVTYLRSDGAPTVVLNQTTPDGNMEIPETPTEGWLCYPQANKHLLFRGNLQHGVSGPLSRAARHNVLGSRRTLLINWWRDAPLPPNCVERSDGDWRRHDLLRSPAALGALAPAEVALPLGVLAPAAPAAPPPRRTWEAMGLDDASATVQFAIEIAPTDLYYFDVLAPRRQPKTVHEWAVRWSREEQVGVLGPISRLDLEHRSMTGTLFREPRPKLVLVLADAGGNKWRGALPRWLRALHLEHAAAFKFVLANPHTTGDFMRVFGLTASDAPTVVIHDTARQAKHKLGEPMSKAAVRRFVRRFLDGQQGGSPAKDEV